MCEQGRITAREKELAEDVEYLERGLDKPTVKSSYSRTIASSIWIDAQTMQFSPACRFRQVM